MNMETIEVFAKFRIFRDERGRYYLEYRDEVIEHDYDIIFRTDENFICIDDDYVATIDFDGNLIKEEGESFRRTPRL